MKQCVFVLAFIAPFACGAQSYFTSANFPAVGTTITTHTCDTTGVLIPTTGQGQTFNYASLSVTSTAVTNYISPDSLWCKPLFPPSTIATQKNNVDWFYKQETDTLRFLGNCLSDSSSTSTFNSYYSRPAVELYKNMGYLATHKDSAHFQYGTGEFKNQVTSFRVIADGSLTLPSGTYGTVHVLRKEMWVRDHSTGDEEEHYLYFQFWDTLTPAPVLEISFFSVFGGTLGFKKVKYFDVTDNISEIAQKPALEIYPNPFTDEFFIESVSGAELVVYDLAMKQVPFSKNEQGRMTRVRLTDSGKGAYFVCVKVNGQSWMYKLIKD